jgi:hypothetical protein
MKKEVADKWVAALRSGEYKQTSGTLNDGGNFCCLGVLCDISSIGKWIEVGLVKGYYTNDISSTSILPEQVKSWAGIKSVDGSFPDDGEISFYYDNTTEQFIEYDEGDFVDLITNLAALNDYGKSFTEIADIIEKNWEKL